jgi:hypothetical protein
LEQTDERKTKEANAKVYHQHAKSQTDNSQSTIAIAITHTIAITIPIIQNHDRFSIPLRATDANNEPRGGKRRKR